MNSSYYQQSELSVIKEAHNLQQQSSESRKIQGEADADYQTARWPDQNSELSD
jgi:hypothetical protein